MFKALFLINMLVGTINVTHGCIAIGLFNFLVAGYCYAAI